MRRLVFGGILAALSTFLDGAGSGAAGGTIPGSPSFVVGQRFEAQVIHVDRAAGILRLKTEAGPLRLSAPEAATAPLKKGDAVVVDVALIRHPAPAGLARRHEEPPPLLTQRLRASITGIHRSVELVALTTAAGRLTLAVPANAIASLHTGDVLLLDLTVRVESEPAALPAMEAHPRGGLAGLLYMIFGRGK